MNPYVYVAESTDNGESLLSLCCGIGYELKGLKTKDITAVDIAPQYLAEVHSRNSEAKLVESDVTEYIKNAESKSVDVISFLDGLEHLTKEDGLICLEECKRVARKKVLIFTQDRFVKNEPHNAWGIEGADEYQKHKSFWSPLEMKDLGYQAIAVADDVTQHGQPYKSVMYEYICSQS